MACSVPPVMGQSHTYSPRCHTRSPRSVHWLISKAAHCQNKEQCKNPSTVPTTAYQQPGTHPALCRGQVGLHQLFSDYVFMFTELLFFIFLFWNSLKVMRNLQALYKELVFFHHVFSLEQILLYFPLLCHSCNDLAV